MKAALIGHPVSQSKSPLIHQYWMEQYGVEGHYDLIDTPDGALEETIQRLIAQGYNGFNITVPYKEKIIPFCDVIDDTAKKIGAVNTVQIIDKKLHGYNTDAYGFIQNLKNSAPSMVIRDKVALVLGAGGAARAVIYGLINEGVEKIYLTNRTIEKAEKLQNDFGNKIEILNWSDRESKNQEIILLVNTTSLGMIEKPSLEFNIDHLNDKIIVSDIVYNPLETDLLKGTKERGCLIVIGIGMLLHQAVPAFELWSGIKPEVTKGLEALVLS